MEDTRNRQEISIEHVCEMQHGFGAVPVLFAIQESDL
jgi:hypothetical protein